LKAKSNIDISKALRGKWEDGTRPKDLYTGHIFKNPEAYVETLIQGLDSDEKRVQSGYAELVSLLSEDRPDLFIPYFDIFVGNLEAKAPILRWEAVCTLGNLAKVDEEKRILPLLPRMYPLLEHKSIVLANHTVQALAKIAEHNQVKAEEILDKLIENSPLFEKTTVGFIIEAVVRFKDYDELVPKVKKFVEPYLESDMKVVAMKARRTMKILG
jgi:hypothetical protein